MDITFLVPGMPFTGDTLSGPDSLGGSETMGALLAWELAFRGHRVRVFTSATVAQECNGVLYHPMGTPSNAAPYGDHFHAWAEKIPQDILVIQRVPGAFHRSYAAKLNFWWTHDLALKRHLPQVSTQLWNVDRILAVSAFHKAQLVETYGPAGVGP